MSEEPQMAGHLSSGLVIGGYAAGPDCWLLADIAEPNSPDGWQERRYRIGGFNIMGDGTHEPVISASGFLVPIRIALEHHDAATIWTIDFGDQHEVGAS